jgi:hypothetical protein
MSLTEQHSAVTRNRSVVALTVGCWLLDVLTVEIYTSGVADCRAPDTSHLFSVLPLPPLPILGTPQIYRLFLIGVETWWWPLQAETCSFIIRIHLSKLRVFVLFDYTSSLSLVSHTTGMTHPEGVIKRKFTTTQNTKLLHNLCTPGNY